MPRYVFGYGSRLTIELAPLVAGYRGFNLSSISLESEGILRSPDSSPGLGPAWEGGPSSRSSLVSGLVSSAGDEAKQIIFTSPWGTPCGKLPDENQILVWFGGLNEREPSFYDISDHGSGWSGVLSEGEKGKVTSAVHLLASLPSYAFLNALADALNSGADGAQECNVKYSAEALIRRVRYRFSTLIDYRLTIDGNSVIDKGEDVEQLGMVDEPIVVGKVTEANPFYKLLYSDDSPISVTRSVFTQGIEIPTSFALPLNWATARWLCPPGGNTIRVRAPAETREALKDLGSQLKGGASRAGSPWTTIVAVLVSLSGPVGPIVGALVEWIANTSEEALDAAGEALQNAGSATYINDLAAHVLTGLYSLYEGVRDRLPALYSLFAFVVERVASIAELSTLGFAPTENLEALVESLEEWKEKIEDSEYGLLFGLSTSDILELVMRLHSDNVLEDKYGFSSSLTWRKPIIHLDPELFHFYSTFRSGLGGIVAYETGYEPDSYTGSWAIPHYPDHDHAAWLRRASPVLQFAYTLELASVILEQTFNQESMLCALSGLASSEGLIGGLVRRVLNESGASGFSEVMGGVPVSRLIRYVWRQAMVDYLLFKAEDADDIEFDMDCLYEIFCWMREEEDRLLLDEVLGTIGDEGSRDFSEGYFAELMAGASPSDWWDGLDSCQRARIADVIELWDKACLNDWLDGMEPTFDGMRDPTTIQWEAVQVDSERFLDEYTSNHVPIERMGPKDWRYAIRWAMPEPERYDWKPSFAHLSIAETLLEPTIATQGFRLEITTTAGVARTWTIRRES